MSANYHHTNIGRINAVEVSHPGSYYELHFAPVAELMNAVFPTTDPATGIISSSITFNKLYKAVVPPVDRGYTEEQQQGDAGHSVLHTVRFFFPFDSKESSLITSNMPNHRFFVLLTTPAGITRLLGDPKNGARFSRIFDSGDTYQDIPGIHGQFTWLNETPAPIVTNVAIFDPTGSGSPGGGSS